MNEVIAEYLCKHTPCSKHIESSGGLLRGGFWNEPKTNKSRCRMYFVTSLKAEVPSSKPNVKRIQRNIGTSIGIRINTNVCVMEG
jgi:hypothetical protein